MPDVIEMVLNAPNPAQVIAEIQEAVDKEQKARAEFIEWLTPEVKAEWIEGEVVVHSPATEGHLLATGCIFKLADAFVQRNKLGKVRVEKALTRIGRNDFEPDVNFWNAVISAEWKKELKIYPPPDFVVEVLSDSTESRDRGVKFRSFQEAGVAEYWLVDPRNETVEQYHNLFEEGVYTFRLRGKYSGDDVIDCLLLKGLSLPIAAFFDEEMCFTEQLRIMRE